MMWDFGVGRESGEGRLSIHLQFDRTGYLKRAMIEAPSKEDEATLLKALHRLVKPLHAGWLSRLLGFSVRE